MSKIYGSPLFLSGSGGANKDLPPLLDNFKAFEGGVVDDGLTRLKDLPSGSKVKLGKWNGTALQWKLARRAGDDQLIFLLEPDSMNVIGKMTYNVNQDDVGYPDPEYYPNNMAKSDIQQWLNATGEAGTWYVQPEETTLKPEYADSKAGFLNQWTNQEINSVLDQEWTAIGMNNSIDQLQTNINYISKITLLTDEHLYNNDHALDIFQNEQDQAVGEIYFVSDCWRVVFYGNGIGVSGMSSGVANPMNEPALIRPICAPNPEAVVSDEPDDDGCYTIDYTKRTVGDLQVGDKIKVSVNADAQSFLGENIVFQVAAHNHPTHPENSATLITEKIIACMAVDAAETSYPNGNPNYSLSNLNQWLNSNAGAGQWWSATHDGDVAPSEGSVDYNPYSQRAGFLNMLDSGFVKSLLETHRVQPQFDDVIKSEIDAKIFNISLFECGGLVTGTTGVSYEVMPLFEAGDSARIAYLTQEAINNSEFDTNRNPSGRDYSHYWWCCDKYSMINIAYVRYNGSVTTAPAAAPNTGDIGIRPACNISNSLPLVSSTPDEEGCYLVDWNKINVTIQADKMLESRANELAGAVWVYGDHEPESVNDGTKIQLTREDVVAPSISALESGSKVRLGTYNGEPLGWIVARDTVTQELRLVLDVDSVATIGTMQYDAEEPSNPNPNRQSSGNNRYSVSNINQWLNSDGAANEWYTAQHEYDAPPSYQNKAGFLNEWSNNDKVILQNKEWVATLTSIDGSGTDTFSQRIVLMSTTELGLQEDTGGNKLDIFNSNSDRLTGSGSYWTRTPHPSTAPSVYDVTAAGSLNTYGNADGSISVRPICAPNPSTPVSGPDDEGYYTIGGEAIVKKTVQWNDESNFFARQFTYNSKKQYQTMREGAFSWILLSELSHRTSTKNSVFFIQT